MNDELYEVARRKLVVLLHLARIRMSSSRHEAEQPGEGHAAAAASVPQVMADLERCKPETRLAERPEPDQDLAITGLLRRLWRTAPDGDRFRRSATSFSAPACTPATCWRPNGNRGW
jgi:hypothetical protein